MNQPSSKHNVTPYLFLEDVATKRYDFYKRRSARRSACWCVSMKVRSPVPEGMLQAGFKKR